jgi:hypothetical protein
LDLLLVYLFQLHQRHPHLHLQRQHGSKSSGEGRSTDSRSDKLGGSLDIHELTRQLVLPGKDAAPLELDGGMGPSSFSEADIQVTTSAFPSPSPHSLSVVVKSWPHSAPAQ